ncbi:30S ribosomal protein S16 [Neoehrlichia mikurensis]|uniref:Small ribosomal subunit protein bS16 n=1 Tax=Neoehrlichia mikurensis TaxID=89586 RepID=A0A9Q9BR53_9RICK|nr:30S ribosomal protein S16 [Neoehrlichia mikurensis]QXK92213.1 30S ribosomal protein S16 [Neoehrlichia mikurensis]QXK92669.1 30S ribosomal protein S16 [Neoehrlichia mikurensis]QXK93906.1 30S ribosomal protein S16 [Neoehrlichia mikurensis]UTO55092.1 30S ribosomal protein S16 [Neoehrlichia mikurensis]UTO56011.1 30S ribosomal protein S16 [Neoehrlichia mikurensis]
MSVKIRLARFGAKKKPFYRIVVSDSRVQRDGRFIELLGFYNPMLSHEQVGFIKVNVDRLKYWLSVGAQPTERISWFIKKNIINLSSESCVQAS